MPAHNLYVSIKGCQSIRNHLGLRDICRKDACLRDRYGQVKLELSQREWKNVDEYCQAKNDVIDSILEQAGLSEDDRDAIRRVNTTVWQMAIERSAHDTEVFKCSPESNRIHYDLIRKHRCPSPGEDMEGTGGHSLRCH